MAPERVRAEGYGPGVAANSDPRRLRRLAILLALGFATAAGAGTAASADTGRVYPPDTALSYVPTPKVPRPDYRKPITDPTFDTTVERITGSELGLGRVVRHVYSKLEPWNSDGSLYLLGYPTTAPLLDGETFKPLRTFDSPGYAVWSNTDPHKIFGVHANRFVSVNPLSDATTLIHRFSGLHDLTIGRGEGNLSNDDRYVALTGADDEHRTHLIVYDLVADRSVGRRVLHGSLDNAMVSQSGTYIVLNWNQNGAARNHGIEVFDRQLHFQRQIATNGEHGDVGYAMDGDEVWVAMSPSRTASVEAYPLDGGQTIEVIGTDPGIGGGHISCRNLDRPGWCYLSDDSPAGKYQGNDQVWAQRIETNGEVEVFAHLHHSYAGYVHEPQAVPNRDGTRVAWASDWDGGGKAPVYDYVAGAE